MAQFAILDYPQQEMFLFPSSTRSNMTIRKQQVEHVQYCLIQNI